MNVIVKGIDPLNQALGFYKKAEIEESKDLILEQLTSVSGKELFYYIELENKIIGYYDIQSNDLVMY